MIGCVTFQVKMNCATVIFVSPGKVNKVLPYKGF